MKSFIIIVCVCLFLSCSFNEYDYEDEVLDNIGQTFTNQPLVENWVVKNISYESDQELYGVTNYLASPLEIVENRAGDCEDYATIYLYLLNLATGEQAEVATLTNTIDSVVRRHAVVLDAYHNYRFSPQSPGDTTTYEDWPVMKVFSYDTWMNKVTDYNTRTVCNM